MAGLLPLTKRFAVCGGHARDLRSSMLGGGGFADPKAVEAEKHCERGVVAVVQLGGEQEDARARLRSGPASIRRGEPEDGVRIGPGSR